MPARRCSPRSTSTRPASRASGRGVDRRSTSTARHRSRRPSSNVRSSSAARTTCGRSTSAWRWVASGCKLLAAAGLGGHAQEYIDTYAIAEPDPDLAGGRRSHRPPGRVADAVGARRPRHGRRQALRLPPRRRHPPRLRRDRRGRHRPAGRRHPRRPLPNVVRHACSCNRPRPATTPGSAIDSSTSSPCRPRPVAREKVMVADEYYQGQLDWYSLDVDTDADPLADDAAPPADPAQSFTSSFFPVNVQFEGMPNTRWWTFEDAKTNFGDIQPDTTDLNKLLLIEFASGLRQRLVPRAVPVAGRTTRQRRRAGGDQRLRRADVGRAVGRRRRRGLAALGDVPARRQGRRGRRRRPEPGAAADGAQDRRRAHRSRTSTWSATRSPTWSGGSRTRSRSRPDAAKRGPRPRLRDSPAVRARSSTARSTDGRCRPSSRTRPPRSATRS